MSKNEKVLKMVAQDVEVIIARANAALENPKADEQTLRKALAQIKAVAVDARQEITGQKEVR
jgi:hypothetical protein